MEALGCHPVPFCVEISQPVFRGRENRVHLFVGGLVKWMCQIGGRMGETVTGMVEKNFVNY